MGRRLTQMTLIFLSAFISVHPRAEFLEIVF